MKRTFNVIGETIKYRNPWMTVIELETETDGKKGIYGIIERANAATLIVESSDHRILFVKQYRYPTNSYSWELPMGGIDKDETPINGALRELEEETGCRVGLKKIGKFNPVPGLTPQKAYVFYGQITTENVNKIESFNENVDEIVDRKFFSYDEISTMIDNQEITDGFTLCSLSIFRWKR